jgi:hypothetical protein
LGAGRRRKENEDLAKRLFSKKKPTSNGASTTLAARHGINKLAKRQTPYARPALRGPPTTFNSQRRNVTAPAAMLNSFNQANNQTRQPVQPAAAVGVSIRGIGSLFVVTGENFEPGTSTADIQHVLHPTELAQLASCAVVRTQPSVVVDLAFKSKSIAQDVIRRFDGLKVGTDRVLSDWIY